MSAKPVADSESQPTDPSLPNDEMSQKSRPLRSRLKFWLLAAVIVLALFGGSVAVFRAWYHHNLSAVSSSSSMVYFTVKRGSGVHQIAYDLQHAGLIRSPSAFETYVTTNNLRNQLQAGTYSLSPSMDVQTIVAKLTSGDVTRNLLTILPAKRLDQIKQAFKHVGYSQKEVDGAFDPAAYAGHPALDSLPEGASLEGYLYPDSFQKDVDTPAEFIISQSLDGLQKRLTPDIIKGFKSHHLSLFQGITLASIVIKETDNRLDQRIVAQVLLTRLERGMRLQADASAFYAAEIAGKPHNLATVSPYNTYLHKGLPPGPISNVTDDALYAVAHPAKTDFLFYVTGDNGQTYFSHTKEEHQAAIQKYCQRGCDR